MRCKPVTVPPGEGIQGGNNLIDASFTGIVDRATAKRRETRTEDDACVEKIRIRYDAFTQTGNRLIDHGQD